MEPVATQWMVKAVFVLRPRKSLHVLHLLLVLLFAFLLQTVLKTRQEIRDASV